MENNNLFKLIDSNVIRHVANIIYEKFHFKNIDIKSYNIIHDIFIFFIAFIIMFNNNLCYLTIILLIVSLDALSIVVLHRCPLSTLEKKYLKKSSAEERKDFLKKLGILYNCNHEYENQIEMLINAWMIVAGKCLMIIFLKTFNIKIFNYNNIYENC